MKIYYGNRWIEVEQNDNRLKELNIIIEWDTRIAQNVFIGEGARIAQNVYIGEGARIAQNVYIGEGARIGHDSSIGQGARIEQDAYIAQNAYIGEGARIERGVYIETIVILYPNKYRIIICNSKLLIGCELHTKDEWEQEFIDNNIAKKHSMDIEDIKFYQNIFEKIKHLI